MCLVAGGADADVSFSLTELFVSDSERIERLLHCLSDSFENNKAEAFAVLEALPLFSLSPADTTALDIPVMVKFCLFFTQSW